MPEIFSVSRREMLERLDEALADPDSPNIRTEFVPMGRKLADDEGPADGRIRVACDLEEMGWTARKLLVILLDRAKDDSPRIEKEKMRSVITAIRRAGKNPESPGTSKRGFELARDFGFSRKSAHVVPLYAACRIMEIVERDHLEHRLERKLSEAIAEIFSDNWENRDFHTDQMQKNARTALMEKGAGILGKCGSRGEMEALLKKSWVIESWVDDPGIGECRYSCADMNADQYGFRRGVIEMRDDYLACIENEPDAPYADDREIMGMSLESDEIRFPFGQTFVCERRAAGEMLEKAGIEPELLIDRAIKNREKAKRGPEMGMRS